MRKKLDKKSAKKFMDKPVAKKKADRKLGDRLAERTASVRRVKRDEVDTKPQIGGAALRGVMEETMARVYTEMWPTMTTHDEVGNVGLEIKEEAYILGLTMVCGNDDYLPRKGLKIREKEMPMPKLCREHKEAA